MEIADQRLTVGSLLTEQAAAQLKEHLRSLAGEPAEPRVTAERWDVEPWPEPAEEQVETGL